MWSHRIRFKLYNLDIILLGKISLGNFICLKKTDAIPFYLINLYLIF